MSTETKTINQLSQEINDNARAKGFWDKERNTGEMLMLIVSEISEALEADRKDRYCDWSFDTPPIIHPEQLNDDEFKQLFAERVKDKFEDELADAVIRIFDLAYSKNINLQWHIEAKMRFNAMRPHMHGKKY